MAVTPSEISEIKEEVRLIKDKDLQFRKNKYEFVFKIKSLNTE